MIMLISAALAASQPAPPADAHQAMGTMHEQHQSMGTMHEQHQAMKEKCCCEHMSSEDGDMHSPPPGSPDQHGE